MVANFLRAQRMFSSQTISRTPDEKPLELMELSCFELEQKTVQPLDNLFGTSLSPMSQVRSVTHVSGLDKEFSGGGRGIGVAEFNVKGPRLLGPRRGIPA